MKQSSVKWFGYFFSFVFLIISCAGTETELTQNQCFSGLWVRFRAYTLHLARLADFPIPLGNTLPGG
jgi:hypothetical protein